MNLVAKAKQETRSELTANNKLASQQRNDLSYKGEHMEISFKHPSLEDTEIPRMCPQPRHTTGPHRGCSPTTKSVERADHSMPEGHRVQGLGDQLSKPKKVEQKGNPTCQTGHSLHRTQIPTGKALCLTN